MKAVAEVSQEGLKQRLNVSGGQALKGTLRVSGAKNSALVLMTASLLSEEAIELTNIPSLTDIDGMSAILESLGVQVNRRRTAFASPPPSSAALLLPTNWSTAFAPVSSALAPCLDAWDTRGSPCLGVAASGHVPSSSTSAA
jgi:UDP-N-acetylglucosamine enolpyruvyl transferase